MKNSVWNKKYSYAFASKHQHGESSDTCKHVALSSKNHPFPVLSAIIEGVGSRLSQQIALSLSLEAITEEFTNLIESKSEAERPHISAEETLEHVISRANNRVYEYGHRMAVGGQISASAIVGVLDREGKFCVGRVGNGEAILFREGHLMPFFEQPHDSRPNNETPLQGLGFNAKALTALSTMEVVKGDQIALCGCSLFPQQEEQRKEFADILDQEISLRERCRDWLKTLTARQKSLGGQSSLPDTTASMLEIG